MSVTVDAGYDIDQGDVLNYACTIVISANDYCHPFPATPTVPDRRGRPSGTWRRAQEALLLDYTGLGVVRAWRYAPLAARVHAPT
jgi:hypothetical protein